MGRICLGYLSGLVWVVVEMVELNIWSFFLWNMLLWLCDVNDYYPLCIEAYIVLSMLFLAFQSFLICC